MEIEMSAFPQMIFHVVESPKVVNTKEELDAHLAKGWSMTSVEFDRVKMVQAKIAYHKSEIERLSEMLEVFDVPVSEEKFICECGYEAKSNAGLAAHKRSHN
jgi:hypothetical protein